MCYKSFERCTISNLKSFHYRDMLYITMTVHVVNQYDGREYPFECRMERKLGCTSHFTQMRCSQHTSFAVSLLSTKIIFLYLSAVGNKICGICIFCTCSSSKTLICQQLRNCYARYRKSLRCCSCNTWTM